MTYITHCLNCNKSNDLNPGIYDFYCSACLVGGFYSKDRITSLYANDKCYKIEIQVIFNFDTNNNRMLMIINDNYQTVLKREYFDELPIEEFKKWYQIMLTKADNLLLE